MSARKQLRCAIYTRKSTEEGLDQEFNSLDAQYEACRAYIQSQKHEGWTLIDERYDDGGYSGGNMDRPALLKLLSQVENRKIDVIVVYKVDRLTRSLMDFSKIVDRLDEHNTSFVSVTQQFNTTTSMGRLTLNVLLSFAQFEREVISERVRDKIAASKKKGMWMGGSVPLGYDVVDRKLVVNEKEAKQVNHIFERYLLHKCVRTLKFELDKAKIRSKERISKRSQQKLGGVKFSRGNLYRILTNPLYIGQTRHKANTYPGEHEPIISKELWNEVQEVLSGNRINKQLGRTAKHPSLLTGMIFDEYDNFMSPTSSHKDKKHYRYYTSQAVINFKEAQVPSISRIPAKEIEELVLTKLQSFLTNKNQLLERLNIPDPDVVQINNIIGSATIMAEQLKIESIPDRRDILLKFIYRVRVFKDEVIIMFSRSKLLQVLQRTDEIVAAPADMDDLITFKVQSRFKRVGLENKIIIPAEEGLPQIGKQDLPLIKAVTRAHAWKDDLLNKHMTIRDIAKRANLTDRYVSGILELAFLSPTLTEAILNGTQPAHIDLNSFERNIPLMWEGLRLL